MDWDISLIGFGEEGWGLVLAKAGLMTLLISVCAFFSGTVLGSLCAWAKLSGSRPLRWFAEGYTTVLRGVPDLLVIYLFYFGGGQAWGAIMRMFGQQGYTSINGFVAGVVAIGLISGAGQCEVLRGAYHAIPVGQMDAARVVGMRRLLMLRRVIAPLALRTALPALGNQWQSVIKESALVSVTGLVETLRQVTIASNTTELPFFFFIVGGAIYLIITTISGLVFRGAEAWTSRGQTGIGRRG